MTSTIPVPVISPSPTLFSETPAREAQSVDPEKSAQPAMAATALTQAALTRAKLTERAVAATASAPTPTPTQTPELAEILPALEAARKPEDVWTSISPDGKWVFQGISQICAEVEGGSGGYRRSFLYYQLKVFPADKSIEWTVYEHYSECGLGYPIYEPVGWSSDSRYFYYAERIVAEGCPAFFPGGVYQVDIANESISHVQDAIDWRLSSDHSRLAMTSDKEVILLDTTGGDVLRIAIHAPQGVLAGLVWAPDNAALILTALEHDCGYITEASIIRLDLPELIQTTLIESGEYTTAFGFFPAAEWRAKAGVLVQDMKGEAWWLNPETGEVIPEQ